MFITQKILHTEFCTACFSGSFINTIRHEAKYEIHIPAKLFYIVQKYYKSCMFSKYFSMHLIKCRPHQKVFQIKVVIEMYVSCHIPVFAMIIH